LCFELAGVPPLGAGGGTMQSLLGLAQESTPPPLLPLLLPLLPLLLVLPPLLLPLLLVLPPLLLLLLPLLLPLPPSPGAC
jgi:hypothetical protein